MNAKIITTRKTNLTLISLFPLNQGLVQTIMKMLEDSSAINEEGQGQQSTTVLKLQIKLNHLTNRHKASLKYYDDIVDLFNDNMSSDNFYRYSQLRCRISFIQSTVTTFNVTHLWPTPCNIVLTNGPEVIVPVFDAKYMILDLLVFLKCFF